MCPDRQLDARIESWTPKIENFGLG